MMGYETERSKAAYGRVMLTSTPAVKFPSVKMILGFWDKRCVCCVSFTKYNSISLSYVRPNASSNKSQASTGNQICGTVESIYAGMEVGRRDEEAEESSRLIPSICTVRSRTSSSLNGKEILLDANFDAS